MPTTREMKPCPKCSKGLMRPIGDAERYTYGETKESGKHLTLQCDKCGYKGKDMVKEPS